MYLVHTFPAISNLIIYATTDIQLSKTHWKGFIPIGIIYDLINFVATKLKGKPLYVMFDWKDYKTPLLLIIMKVFFVGIYILVAKLSIRYNQRNKKTKEVETKKEN